MFPGREFEAVGSTEAVGMRRARAGVGRRQAGVLRYNCADSLDRTNLAGFFGSVQVREHSEKNQGTCREHAGNIQCTFRKHSGDIQGTFREHSVNVQ
jgi:hypothetical protein